MHVPASEGHPFSHALVYAISSPVEFIACIFIDHIIILVLKHPTWIRRISKSYLLMPGPGHKLPLVIRKDLFQKSILMSRRHFQKNELLRQAPDPSGGHLRYPFTNAIYLAAGAIMKHARKKASCYLTLAITLYTTSNYYCIRNSTTILDNTSAIICIL